ncbi:MAG: hypothetical protein QM784_00015 [Polyangiaceae bacterium]
MRKLPSIALALTLIAGASSASAQVYGAPFGNQGQMVFAAERLFGFHWSKVTWDNQVGDDGDKSGTVVGIGWAFSQPLQFNQPRAGFDYFISRDLSLGGALGFFSGSRSDVNYDGFIFHPRIGFNIPLSTSIYFWPRVGPEYISVGDDHALGIGGEGNFVFLARPDWGFMLSPTLDLAPFGGHDQPGENSDVGAYSFGVSLGLLGVL